MYLAGMIALDEDALICDLAETYHIYDMCSFEPSYIAILAVGLPDGSRIKKRLSGTEVDLTTIILAKIADNTAINVWTKTKDAQKGRNRPKSLLDTLLHRNKENNLQTFRDGATFMEKWRSVTHGG